MNENNQDSVSVYINDQLVTLQSPATLLQVYAAAGNHINQEHKIVAAVADGEMVDLTRSLPPRAKPYRVEFIDTSTEEGMEILRHSTSHLMTQAIKRIFGQNTQLGVGPATKTGFYQDYDLPSLSDNDLPKIEAEMHKIVAEANDVERMELSKQEALDLFAHDELKRELICEIPSDTVTVYRQKEHYDLCRGPHVANSSMIGAFKLMHVSGAYWRGDARRTVRVLAGVRSAVPERIGSGERQGPCLGLDVPRHGEGRGSHILGRGELSRGEREGNGGHGGHPAQGGFADFVGERGLPFGAALDLGEVTDLDGRPGPVKVGVDGDPPVTEFLRQGQKLVGLVEPLLRAVQALRTLPEAWRFFRDLMTDDELEMMARRWRVVSMLSEGVSYRRIWSSMP